VDAYNGYAEVPGAETGSFAFVMDICFTSFGRFEKLRSACSKFKYRKRPSLKNRT
jgi:hypothetical protein